MAECGNCRAVIARDSTECPECNIKFSGVSEEALGECGGCGFLVPLESTSCSSCGVIFVADDVMDVLRKWLSNTGLTIQALFNKFDTNGDGMIDSDELRQGLLSLNLADLPPSQIERLIEIIDEDGNGEIDLAELEHSVTGSEYTPSTKEDGAEEKTSGGKQSSSESAGDEGSESEDSKQDEGEDSDDDAKEADDEESDADAEDESEEDEDDKDEESDDAEDEGEEAESHSPQQILQLLIDEMDQRETSPSAIFNVLDEDGDKTIDGGELSKRIAKVLDDEEISEASITEFIATLDSDKDGNIDMIEFISAIEAEEEASEEGSPSAEFPTAMQTAMMSKKWNDVWWPIIHVAFAAFILIWVVNGLIGPVDGSGGSIELETPYGMGFGDLSEGDIYSCDSEVQAGGCSNSLTPFSGEDGATSMPKGFYLDGILLMLLGAAAMAGSMFTHLVLAKGWRARMKAMKEVASDTEDAKEAAEDEDEDQDSDSEDDEEADADSQEDEDSPDDDEQEDADDEEEGAEDDDIDVGSHIGLTVDDEDFFGVIIEFDDVDGLVTIKEDGSGDEITGYQDEMFLE